MTLSYTRRATIPVIAIVLLAALAWLVGFLPGMLPDASPFDAAAMGELVALAIVAGTLGGATAAIRRDRPAAAIGAAGGGVALIALAAIFVLGERGLYVEPVLRVLQLVTVIVTVVTVALGQVAALGPSWLRGLSLAPLAGAAYSWFGQAVPRTMSMTDWWVWLMVPVLAGALALSVGRGRWGLWALLTWPVVLAVVWIVQTVIIALTAIGPMVRPGYGVEEHPDVLFGEFLAYASQIFTTPGVHQVPLLGWSVVIALVVVVVRLAIDRRSRSSAPSADEVEKPEVQADNEPVRHRPRLRWVEILLAGFSVLLVLVALANVFTSYFCFAGAGYCGPPRAESVVTYRVVLALMALSSLGALGLAVLRRSVSGVISHLVVAFVVALSAVLFAVPAIDWQPSTPEPPVPEPNRSEAPACYSGGDSDECPGG
ncbi:DUF6234 family protein [Nocardioides albus]|uniref:DUF6234 domain-containing protein n=1 Tax=Nocardioides albus TaxID=1841 RepID=A0A7W5FAV0_9ACTN|nr:DUF6234 family protein [Nocardioides albus]MBB3091658.1 hypothetical protein [Nocardioides albus]GGU44844.1 hypothetical protein GCM10007979_49920 [Nocardioides albus]